MTAEEYVYFDVKTCHSLTVCYYYITYEFQIESTLYTCILKRVRDKMITYSQMRRTNKYSQHSSIV